MRRRAGRETARPAVPALFEEQGVEGAWAVLGVLPEALRSGQVHVGLGVLEPGDRAGGRGAEAGLRAVPVAGGVEGPVPDDAGPAGAWGEPESPGGLDGGVR